MASQDPNAPQSSGNKDDRGSLEKFADGFTDCESAGKATAGAAISYEVIEALGNHQDSASDGADSAGNFIEHLFDWLT